MILFFFPSQLIFLCITVNDFFFFQDVMYGQIMKVKMKTTPQMNLSLNLKAPASQRMKAPMSQRMKANIVARESPIWMKKKKKKKKT